MTAAQSPVPLRTTIVNWDNIDLVLSFGGPVPDEWDRALDPEFKFNPQGTQLLVTIRFPCAEDAVS